ncbi:MAG: hypothetical protein AVDCRST_MAG13-1642, partial [uncultured Solirubrobacteraceae bacterium]
DLRARRARGRRRPRPPRRPARARGRAAPGGDRGRRAAPDDVPALVHEGDHRRGQRPARDGEREPHG